MADLQLILTAEEQRFLTELLEAELKERKIEEHRTRAPTYRGHVLHEEELVSGVLKKLRGPAQ